MSNLVICAPNHIKNTYLQPVFSGGDWEADHGLENLRTKYFIDRIVSVNANAASTRLHIDFQTIRDVKFLGVADCNLGRAAEARIVGSQNPAWSNVVVSGVNALNATTLNVSATGQANIIAGQGFSIAGDAKIYNVVTGIGLGENRITRSQDFSHASWTKTNVSVSADQDYAPDCETKSADVVSDNGTYDLHYVEGSFTVTSGDVVTVSIYAKKRSRTRVHLVGGSSGNLFGQGFDLADGTTFNSDISGVTNASVSSIEEWEGGFYRLTVTFTSAASTNYLRVYLDGAASGASSPIYSGATGAIFLWGAQAVVGTEPKTYVATAGSAATTSGSITLVRGDKSGTGLALATTGAEEITCHSGDFLENAQFDTGMIEYHLTIYGNEPIWGDDRVWDGRESEENLQTYDFPRQGALLLPSFALVRYVCGQFFDPSNTDGYVWVSKIYTSSVYEPTYNADYGAVLGLQSNTSGENSPGGATVYQTEKSQRYCEFTLSNTTIEEAFTNTFDIQRRLDISEEFFFMFDPAVEKLRTRQSFPATFDGGLGGHRFSSYNITSSSHRILEKLA